ncbi:glycoside hydrolase family 19 protein [Nocardia sp. NPDC057440]|uniref:glycoside hydrolase family 19 protein n=1 Tax=Nocardia sp. NPDC057440 TaxID=3346134 RepID=UPI00366DD739
MGPAQNPIRSRIVAEAEASEPPATSPGAAGPDNAAICPTNGWFGWTVQLFPPPKAQALLKQSVELACGVIQSMVDQLGVGKPNEMPDVNELLRDAGLTDKNNKSIATTNHNDMVGKIADIKQGLIDDHTKIADKVAAAAKQGTELNTYIWNEVVDLRTALTAVGSDELPASLEDSLLEQVVSALQRVWKKFEAVTGYNSSSSANMGPLTLAQLKALLPKTDADKLEKYLPYLNEAMRKAGITNPKREAAFLAQVIHETDQLQTLTEYGDTEYFNSNYGPQTAVGQSLGNDKSGDGARFRGRGALQVTGRDNYRAAGKEIGVDLVSHPELAADPKHAFDVAGWYWKTHDLNDEADKSQFDAITREINGGTNGSAQREEYYQKAKKILDAD